MTTTEFKPIVGDVERKHRRRWVPWVVAYGSVLVLGAIALGVHGLETYSPIGPGNGAYIGGPYLFGGRDGRPYPYVTRALLPGVGDETIIKYSPGKDFVIGFDIENRGRWGVTVIDVPVERREPYWSIDAIKVGILGSHSTPPPTTPFHSFSLEPGMQRWIEVDYHMPVCSKIDSNEVGGGISIMGVPITFRFAGFARTQFVPSSERVFLQATGPGCY